MELSPEQLIAFDKYVQGENIFITGPGGSGKSALIRKIKEHNDQRVHYQKQLQVCALTGCAAILLNCKAKTLHSWAGIGLGNGTIEQNVSKIINSSFKKKVWKGTNILIVDEVSMLSLKLFDMLNQIGKLVRKNSRPFGGIQLIFSGDFYQLPPVGSADEPDSRRFCFESDDWDSVFHKDCQIQLIKIFRQTDDTYSSILNQIRVGRLKKKSNELLLQYVDRPAATGLIVEPTKMFPTKHQVEFINNSKMAALDGIGKDFVIKNLSNLEMTQKGKIIRSQCTDKEIQCEFDYLTRNLICDANIKLKIGCQVMCIVNIPLEDGEMLVCNGSQGIVTRFCLATGLPFVRYNKGIEMLMSRHIWESETIPGIGVAQVPLILAWALTIHKSQGATLDVAEIDVGSGIFECGQTYVALSRVRSLEGLYLTSFDAQKIKINKKVKYYYEALTLYHESKKTQEEVYIPVVVSESCTNVSSTDVNNVFTKFHNPSTMLRMSTDYSQETSACKQSKVSLQHVESTNVIPLDDSSKL
jgi:ATP-dependent DNA helicase PIF1